MKCQLNLLFVIKTNSAPPLLPSHLKTMPEFNFKWRELWTVRFILFYYVFNPIIQYYFYPIPNTDREF